MKMFLSVSLLCYCDYKHRREEKLDNSKNKIKQSTQGIVFVCSCCITFLLRGTAVKYRSTIFPCDLLPL